MPTWDNALYDCFRSQRTQPATDLVSRIPNHQPSTVADLGCGGGNSTAVLRARWPDAKIIGVDNSEEMLGAARKNQGEVSWVKADIAAWEPPHSFDVLFSNAALQWVPDHETLIPRLLQYITKEGVLAVQVPDHYDSPLYRVLLEVSRDPRWSSRMEVARDSLTRHPVPFYYDVLSGRVAQLDLWTTEYQHVLSSHEDILTFHRGTGMRPYLESLDENETEAFERQVLVGYRDAFPVQPDGNVIFPFKRIFFLARLI